MHTFYLGTHICSWLERALCPLMVSYSSLRNRRRLPMAVCPWIQDSRGFTELSQHGRWTFSSADYAAATLRNWEEIGMMVAASIRDWMCEPFVLAQTGKTIAYHQTATVESFFELTALAPCVPWMPVLQGWHYADYMRHIEEYARAGLDLRAQPLVGLGSVCRRENTLEVEQIIRALHGYGLRIHAFGFKIRGLARVHGYLQSSDSMAWSYGARYDQPLPGCQPGKQGTGNCANCIRYAMLWRERVISSIATPIQGNLPL